MSRLERLTELTEEIIARLEEDGPLTDLDVVEFEIRYALILLDH